MIEGLRHILFPEVCVACRALLNSGEHLVCRSCFTEFAPYPGPAAGGEALKRVIQDHFGQAELPAEAWCLYPYRGSGRLHEAMHSLKYEGIFPLGNLFGRKLGELVAASRRVGFDAIVPVPLHRLKLVERTYNQSEKIAEGLSEVLGIPVVKHALVRMRYTGSQTGLSSTARRKNVQAAFGPGRQPSPARVLVVDDVVTTGATMVAAAGVLRGSGALSVSFAAVAITEKT
ncbi:MAG: ComF family protein [Chlorobiaceae bacterium]|nr:ComF family protein [Chlorobiaceae bacterium]